MLETVAVGAVIGLAQGLVGHPFDTVKTLLQNGQSYRRLGVRGYYRGWAYPTTASVFFNATVFPAFGELVHDGAYVAGFKAGCLAAPIEYAFDIG